MRKTTFGWVLFGALVVGVLTFIVLNVYTSKPDVSAPVTDGPPAGRPSTSAPAFAITACENKTIGDACVMQFGGEDINGLCFQSGSAIACGPSTPSAPDSVTADNAQTN